MAKLEKNASQFLAVCFASFFEMALQILAMIVFCHQMEHWKTQEMGKSERVSDTASTSISALLHQLFQIFVQSSKLHWI